MVSVSDGRFLLPEQLKYTQTQHVYLDIIKKKIGIDQIGYEFLKNPKEIKVLVENKLIVDQPFAVIETEKGITTLNSPCSGIIKNINNNALKGMEDDVYSNGYILELEEIDDIRSSLITGDEVRKWGESEARSLFPANLSYKIIEIGDSAVGKTAIKVRFAENYFKKNLKTTLGVDFGSKKMKCEYISSDILFTGSYHFNVTMNVWDAAGQSHYDKIRGMYYRSAKGALLCYDVNNELSFQHLDKWIAELEENLGKRVPVLLVGNKTDLERKVSRQEALSYAIQNNFLFVECSAKTGEGIDEAFHKLAVEIYKKEEGLD